MGGPLKSQAVSGPRTVYPETWEFYFLFIQRGFSPPAFFNPWMWSIKEVNFCPTLRASRRRGSQEVGRSDSMKYGCSDPRNQSTKWLSPSDRHCVHTHTGVGTAPRAWWYCGTLTHLDPPLLTPVVMPSSRATLNPIPSGLRTMVANDMISVRLYSHLMIAGHKW